MTPVLRSTSRSVSLAHRIAGAIVVAYLSFFCISGASAQNADQLLRATKTVREMDEEDLVDLVPLQSGLQYVGCPNCNGGRQERQLTWTIERPDEVACQFCGHRYPSDKYPMQEAVVVTNPRGEPAEFDYWADDSGYRYFFNSRRDDEVRRYLARQTLKLAQLYAATGDKQHARRAAVILDRFAQVFPGWCYHYDYPFRQKEIYDGDVKPEDFRSGFRTARWNWWAYHDIPGDLVEAFRLIRESGALEELSKELGVDVAGRIENDLLRNAGQQVIANRDDCTNMSPSVWRSLVRLGRVIDEPRYVHEVVRRFKRLMQSKFVDDVFWYEGSPSYAWQTLTSLEGVLDELRGYSDPPGYVDPIDGTRFDNLDLRGDFPLLTTAHAAVEKLRLPNGRLVPVHDTWAYTRRGEAVSTAESYLLPALGHACLMGGSGPDRSEFHLTWSGGYGHQHLDLLSLLLFSHGRESLSDLGYTHTAYRSWALATASHNTVVIDGQSQSYGALNSPTDGDLRLADLGSPYVQTVSCDGVRAYPDVAETYRRTLAVVEVDEHRSYAVDLFEVKGGTTHDYFLHGDADAPAQLVCDLKFDDLQSLLPAGFDWTPTKNEGEARRAREPYYAYGFLRDLQTADVSHESSVAVDFQSTSQADAGLRVTLCPQPDSQLVLGENPSIRQASEDDGQLDEYHRPFLVLRRHAKGERSLFVSVIEPHGATPFITSIKRMELTSGAVALRIEIDDRIDTIVFGAEKPQSVSIESEGDKGFQYRGQFGMLCVRAGDLERAYALGEGGWRGEQFELTSAGRQSTRLMKIERNALIVAGADVQFPSAGDVVRLVTADDWVYPYTVQSASPEDGGKLLRVEVAEGPGVEFNKATQQLRLTSYPQRQHQGEVEVQWQRSATWPSDLLE